ncbi:hypothetical protein MPH_04516 [Macrophomina phaseolina MS6]|uniref:Uncharacterized protein n=1 Tax=Macrophomina phaseolina (strain MS6) TaxID=1126212 RepID=K2R7A9_MACPH|nr:hypothetical protein MPH_04516 [Macrophomina phaseolina MS6]
MNVSQQDLRRTIYEPGASDIQQSISEASSISLHNDITISLYPPFSTLETSTNTIPPSTLLTGSHNPGVPEPHHEQLIKHVALQIAQSVFVQSGLRRRYWDPPLTQFHHDVEANQHLGMQEKLPKTVALVDINIAGDPIRMRTLDFDVNPRGLKIGACLFLNLPYGANDACGLHIKMKDGTASEQPRFFLEVVTVVLETGTGKKRWRLCTRHDVTGIIMKMARKRVTLETATSSLEHPTRNLTLTVDSQRSSNSEFFDWAAFAEDELEADLSNASQPAEQHAQQHRPNSRTPFHHSAQSRFRLSGSTIVPTTCDTPDSAACFSTRSTLVATAPTPVPTINRARHHPATTPSQSPSFPFDAIPEDIHTFLRLADGIRRTHAGLFFILVPLRGGKYHPAIANAMHGILLQ